MAVHALVRNVNTVVFLFVFSLCLNKVFQFFYIEFQVFFSLVTAKFTLEYENLIMLNIEASKSI